MIKILILAVLSLPFLANAQTTLCLSTQCTATHTQVGDTISIGAKLVADAGVASIVFTQAAGPNNAIIGAVYNGWYSGAVDTGIVKVSGLIAGTYLIKIVGSDKGGGVTAPQYDTIIVAAATPACPVQRTVTGITIPWFGGTITIPVGAGTKITFSDGTTQQY